jgi:hypothetical protein
MPRTIQAGEGLLLGGHFLRLGLSRTRRHQAIREKKMPSSTIDAMFLIQTWPLWSHSGSVVRPVSPEDAAGVLGVGEALADGVADAWAFLCLWPGLGDLTSAAVLADGDTLLALGVGVALVLGVLALGELVLAGGFPPAGAVPEAGADGAAVCPVPVPPDLPGCFFFPVPAGGLTAGALGSTGCWITFRLEVDAVAAYPHRDGASQEI